MTTHRKILLTLALLFGLVAPAVVNVSPASAALSCPLQGPNLNNGYVCADAVYAMGSGYVYVSLSKLDNYYYAAEIQTKTGTMGWVKRCSVSSNAPVYCTGAAGFANGSNIVVRVKAWRTSTSYAYFDVPVSWA